VSPANISLLLQHSDFRCPYFQMLDENNQLIQAIIDYQNKGKAQEVMQ
jgi:hypothetical protein